MKDKLTGSATALLAAQIALDKKATDVRIYDIASSVADYLVIATADSDPQAQAIADTIQRRFRDHGIRPLGIEGKEGGHWLILDYNDVIIHVLLPEARGYYRLDEIWEKCSRIDIPAEFYTQAAG